MKDEAQSVGKCGLWLCAFKGWRGFEFKAFAGFELKLALALIKRLVWVKCKGWREFYLGQKACGFLLWAKICAGFKSLALVFGFDSLRLKLANFWL